MIKQKSQIIYFLAGSLTVVGAILHIVKQGFAPYIFTSGIVLIIILQFKIALDNRNSELQNQRLSRINFLSSLFLAIAAYFMFTNSNLWVIPLLIYALVALFTSFRGE